MSSTAFVETARDTDFDRLVEKLSPQARSIYTAARAQAARQYESNVNDAQVEAARVRDITHDQYMTAWRALHAAIVPGFASEKAQGVWRADCTRTNAAQRAAFEGTMEVLACEYDRACVLALARAYSEEQALGRKEGVA